MCARHVILARMNERDTAAELERAIERYNEAWNAHDVPAIVALHAPEWSSRITPRASASRATTSRRTSPRSSRTGPTSRFRGRRSYVRDGLVVSEWTASATDSEGRRLEWDGVDIFPFENGLILRKDVYSSSHRARVLES